MAGTDPDEGTSPSAGDLPQDPASAEANAATIDHLRTLLADHAAGRIRSDLWEENRPGHEQSAGAAPAQPPATRGATDDGAGVRAADRSAQGAVPFGKALESETNRAGRLADGVADDQAGMAAPGPDRAGEPGAAGPTEAGARRGTGGDSGRETDPFERGREIALRQLSFSARSRHQLANAMLEREIPEPVVTEILDRFEQVGLVDDAEYAAMLVRTRYQERGLARPALAEELRRKGITGAVAEAALDQIDGDDERLAARELVERRLRSMGPVEPVKRRQRLYAMLARRGYGTSVAVAVVDEALAAEGLSRY